MVEEIHTAPVKARTIEEVLDAIKGLSVQVAEQQEKGRGEVKSALRELQDAQAILPAKWDDLYYAVMDIKSAVARLEGARVIALTPTNTEGN
jgi:hypothetical protein